MRNFANLATSGQVNSVQMDKFAYHYKVDGSGTEINQLDNVYDMAGPSQFGNADLTNNQLAGNYQYNEIGQLKSDASENIATIQWTVYNKIKEITYTGPLAGKHIVFDYNSSGIRIAKHVTHAYTSGTPQTTSTFYVLDAQGNSMSTYEMDAHSSNQLSLLERNIYGSSRVGMEQANQAMLSEVTNTSPAPPVVFDNGIGDKRFELANHLGNVLNTITDRKLPVSDLAMAPKVAYNQSDVVSYSDYLPFGQVMPNRHGSDNSYRYGFNGQEKSNEISVDGGDLDFGARIYDSRLGRWMAVDKMAFQFQDQSPYSFGANSPIYFIDEGGNVIMPNDQHSKDAVNAKLDKLMAGDLAIYRNQIVYDVIGSVPVKVTDVNTGNVIVKNVNIYGFKFIGKEPGTPGVTDFDENTIIKSNLGDKDKLTLIAYFKTIKTNDVIVTFDASSGKQEYLNLAINRNDGGASDEQQFENGEIPFSDLTGGAQSPAQNTFKEYPNTETYSINVPGTNIKANPKSAFMLSNSTEENVDNAIVNAAVHTLSNRGISVKGMDTKGNLVKKTLKEDNTIKETPIIK